nr:NAD-dependent epimerase/dehydratase family protein [Pseudomonadota bacterium]NIS72657.1 NAD-dependent epimerase/dehydratase family protein [Pseudomonadota bacterium]
ATGTGLVDESTPCNPKSLYEKSKYAGEKLALDAFERFRIPVTVLRPTIVFGEKPNRGPDSLGSWLNAIQKGWFRFFGSGDSVANYIYVGDVVNACLLLAENEKAIGEVYIVSDPCSLRDFVGVAAEFLDVQMPGIFPTWLGYTAAIAFEAVGKLARFSPPLTVSRVRALRNQLLYSSEKIRKRLGFTPVFGWRNGLFRTVEWYKRNKLL